MMRTDKSKNDVLDIVSEKDSNVDAEDNIITSIMSPQTGKLVSITADGDVAMNYATGEKEVEIDEATNKRILRKIDLCLMPIMCLLYCFQFIDKMTNSFASVMGMREDLKMVGDQYSWSGTSFYLGYLAFEFPVSLVTKVPCFENRISMYHFVGFHHVYAFSS